MVALSLKILLGGSACDGATYIKGVQFDEEELIKYESRFCTCGVFENLNKCIRCRAKELDASVEATITLYYTDNIGNVIAEEDVWLH